MTGKSSFFNQNTVVYDDTNPAGPADAPLPTQPSDAPSSFFKSAGRTYATSSTASENVEIAVSIPGPPFITNEWLFGYKFDVAGTFPVNFAGAQGVAGVAATAPATFSVRLNGTQFGTITFTGTTPTFSCPETSFVPGDFLEVIAPTVIDLTLQHISFTLFATRN